MRKILYIVLPLILSVSIMQPVFAAEAIEIDVTSPDVFVSQDLEADSNALDSEGLERDEIIPEQDIDQGPDLDIAADQQNVSQKHEEVLQEESGEIEEEPLKDDEKNVILLMGDSYASGPGKLVTGMTDRDEQYWPNFAAVKLDNYICCTYACGGTGFAATWKGNTIPSLLDLAIQNCKNGELVEPEEVKWVIVAAGFNDRYERYYPDELKARIVQFVDNVREGFPNAKIAIGVVGWCSSDKENADDIQARINDAVVPVYWETAVSAGAYYIDNLEYVLRSHEEAISSDGVHPTAQGSELIASYISAFLNNVENDTVEIDYYYPDGLLCSKQIFADDSDEEIFHPEIDLGDGIRIGGWERDSRLNSAEYEGGFTIGDWADENGSYTQLYGVFKSEGSSFSGFKKAGDTWWYFYNGKLWNDLPIVIQENVDGQDGLWRVDSNGRGTPVIPIAEVALSGYNFDYTGKAITPKPIVRDETGRQLAAGTDYTVTYENNIYSGTAKVTVTGVNQYTGSKEIAFNIKRKSCNVKSFWVSSHSVGAVVVRWAKESDFVPSGWQIKYRIKKIGNNSWSAWTERTFNAKTYEFECSVPVNYVVEMHAKEIGDSAWSTGVITTPAGGKYQAMKATYVKNDITNKRIESIKLRVGQSIRLKPDYEYPDINYEKRPRLYPTQALWDLDAAGKSMLMIKKSDGSTYTGGMIDGAATVTAMKAGTTTLICRAPNGRAKTLNVTVTGSEDNIERKPCNAKSFWVSSHTVGAVVVRWAKESDFVPSGWQIKYRIKKIGNNSWSAWTERTFNSKTYEFECSVPVNYVVEMHAKEIGDSAWSTGVITTPAGGKYQAMKATYVKNDITNKRIESIKLRVGQSIRLKPDYEYPDINYEKRPQLYPTQALWDLDAAGKTMLMIKTPNGSTYTGGMINGVATVTAIKAGTTTLICRAPNGRTKVLSVSVMK